MSEIHTRSKDLAGGGGFQDLDFLEIQIMPSVIDSAKFAKQADQENARC